MSFPPSALRQAASDVTDLLKAQSAKLCVGETAAGGLTSASLLAVPGASSIYAGGLTLYTLESRIAFAGWTQDNLKNYSGPSPDIVKGLAENIRSKLGCEYAIAESGTAGPRGSGDGRNRQPGYVALAVASEHGTVTKEIETELGGDREGNMIQFAVEALRLLEEVLESHAESGSKM